MGLDALELVLAVEDAFSFSIPDADAAGLDTVGKLYDYIITHRFQGQQEACLTSVAFYKIRCAMMSVLQVARKDVLVSSELSTLIPVRRRQAWRDLEKETTLRLPELRRPVWVTFLAALATVGLTMGAVKFFLPTPLGVALLSVILGAVAYTLFQMTTPLAVEFRPAFATVGKLTKVVLAKNYGAISDECRCSNANEVWESLRSIIVEQLGVQPNVVTKEAHFVKDLGV